MQFLHRDAGALSPAEEWFWRETKAEAYVFGSHAAAEIQAAKMPYHVAGIEREFLPVAVVTGTPQLEYERATRRRDEAARLAAAAEDELHLPALSAEECAARLEKQHLF
jgi:hypothetical protein